MDIKKAIESMSQEEKVALCSGQDNWHTKEFPDYGIPKIKMSDGPHGLRCQVESSDALGINRSEPATCFPSAVTASASWDMELYEKEGEAIAKEAKSAGVSVLLGPGLNIKRNPLCGRSFEYLSEDPYLAGRMAGAFVRGVEGTGVSACMKHFAVNNQEYKRMNGDSQIDERTLREIYLAPFEIGVKEGRPSTIMCSYNRINGTYASDNRYLLTDILRGEWGFEGIVMTDWGAMNDRIEAFRAGCELNMPGGSNYMEWAAKRALASGELDAADLDRAAERVLRLVERGASIEKSAFDRAAHHALATKMATEGAVLLKNEGGLLPVRAEDIVLIGSMAANIRYQGSGSSHINSEGVVNITDAMPGVPYIPVGDANGALTEEELGRAAEAAGGHRVALVVIGLPPSFESEGFDREHLRLPDGYNALVKRVAEANPNVCVILFGGGVMELPWAGCVKSILFMGLPGEGGGEAVRDLVLGAANPSGKLTESWPISYNDVISRETFGKKSAEYREGIYVGYRYYDKVALPVRFPFGHGLSYTSFEYSALKIEKRRISLTVRNTGDKMGAEVVQLYVAPKITINRPRRELRGFARVELMPNEARRVEFSLDDRAFSIWDNGWRVIGGEYTIEVGSSSREIRESGRLRIIGEGMHMPAKLWGTWYDTLSGMPTREEWELLMGRKVEPERAPRRGEFTINNSCYEMKDHSLVMRIMYKIIEHRIAKQVKALGGAPNMSNPTYRMLITNATDGALRAITIASIDQMTEAMARGLVDLANGHLIRGIVTLIRGLK